MLLFFYWEERCLDPQTLMYYILYITYYLLLFALYPLTLASRRNPEGFLYLRDILQMNQHYDPRVCIETLKTYQGYSLQVFTSGRIKLSFHITHNNRLEYYCECPKRYREAYLRQASRSVGSLPEHFALVDQLLSECAYALTFRVHLKANNNATADNAHVVVDTDTSLCHVVLDQLHHQWELPTAVVQSLLGRTGPRTGAAACFNEYMPSYDHDWCDAHFHLNDYAHGYRAPKRHAQVSHSTVHDPDGDF
jgi:hypothetical protein